MCDCCDDKPLEFIPIEDVEGPLISYDFILEKITIIHYKFDTVNNND